MRSYARGEQDVSPIKKTIEGERKNEKNGLDVKTHKIDYTPLRIFPTFMDLIVNPTDESLFKPRAQAIDRTAVNNKKNYLKKMEDDFYTQELAQLVSQGIGIDITPKDIPVDERGLEVKKLEFKPLIELAQELAVESVMKSERFEVIKDSIDPDLVALGIGVGRHYTDNTEGIKLKYVDPYNFISNAFEMEDGRDIRLAGVMEKGTIADLEKQAGGLTKEQLKDIKNVSINNLTNNDAYIADNDSHRLVEYLYFTYEVRKERVYKRLRKNKNVTLIDRSKDEESYNPSNPAKKMSIPYKVWYEGIYIPTAKVLIKWNEIPNQAADDVNTPLPPFVVYAPKVKKLSEKGQVRFDSLVARAIPIIDDIHRDWYKFQQLKMELRPSTVKISPRALNNTMLNGEKVSGQDLLDMYFGRGVLLADEYDEDGIKIADAIQERAGGISNNAISFLSNEIVNGYGRLRQLLGINEVRDGTTKPNSKTAVTVQKLLLASSNNQTNHIVNASFNISLRFAEAVSSRLVDVWNTPALKDRYMDMIGSDNVQLLDELKKYPTSKFAIYFDFKPDNDERVAFESSLVNSYNQKEINVAQYNQARQISNVKSAIKYLEYVIDENEKKKQAETLQNIQANAQANAQTGVLVEQTKQQTLTVEFETKKNLLLLEAQIKSQEFRNNAMIDELAKQEQHKRNLELEQLKFQGKSYVDSLKEDSRLERINQQSSNTSEIVDQKINKKPPIDFNNRLSDIFDNQPLLNQNQ